MNITEIQTELNKLVVLMTEKGLVSPDADITVPANRKPYLYLSNVNKVFEGNRSKFIQGGIKEMFEKALEVINNLPSPEEAVTREYLSKVASAVDYATENSIADEYVNPLRGVSCAMTDNLLVNLGSNDDSCCPVEDHPQGDGHYFHAPTATEYVRADLAPQWHRIDDPENLPPKNGTVIQVWIVGRTGHGKFSSNLKRAYWSHGGWVVEGVGGSVEPIITQWIHLPTPPDAAQ